jgi:hypothetical protein
MGILRVLSVDPDPASIFVPDRLPNAAEVLARYRVQVVTEERQLTVRYCVFRWWPAGDRHVVSARPEFTHEWMTFVLHLGGEPLHSPVRWSRILSSVVESIHQGFDHTLTEFEYP